MRTAISNLEKCLGYSTNLTVENVVKALGISDYERLNKLLYLLLVKQEGEVIEIVEKIYSSGKDLKQFIKQFIQYILDVCKYVIYRSYDYIQIPTTINLTGYTVFKYEDLLNILDNIIELQNQIKYESNPKVLIEAKMLLLCKGE